MKQTLNKLVKQFQISIIKIKTKQYDTILGSNKLLYMSYSLKSYLNQVLNEMKESIT